MPFSKMKLALLSTLLLVMMLSGCSTKPSINTSPFSLETPRLGHAAVNDGRKIYVLAGSNKSGFLSDIEIIDPVTREIQVLKNKLIPRRYFSAVWDGKNSIYILGGISYAFGTPRYENRVEVFNTLTQEVSFTTSLPLPTRINSAVFLDERIFVFGGAYPQKGKLAPTAKVAVFNTKTQRWFRASDMPTAKTTRAVVKDSNIYVVGGYDRKTSLNVFEKFDPRSNKWESLPPMPVGISAHSVTVVKDKLFVFGDYNNLKSTYSYDFRNEQWEKIEIGYKASRHTAATTLADVTYVIGGNTGTSGPFHDYIQIFEF